MPPRLARMHIAYMQLDKRDIHPQQRIADGHRCMREAAGVDNNAINAVAGGSVDAVDQRPFMVGLEGVERGAEAGGVGFARGFDVGEGGVAVNVWLAAAQEVEVRAVEEEDGFAHFVCFSLVFS